MNSQATGLKVAGTVFGIVALVQLLRLLFQADVSIAGYHVPLWPSGVAFLITGALCVWLWSLARRN